MFPIKLRIHFPIELGICGLYFCIQTAVKLILLGTAALIVLLNKLAGDWICRNGKKHSSEQLSSARQRKREKRWCGEHIIRILPGKRCPRDIAATLITYDNLLGRF